MSTWNCSRRCSATADPEDQPACSWPRYAALADENGSVEGLTTDDLCRVAGLANSTYRRARNALVASGEVSVDGDRGGRGRMCHWTVRHPAEIAAEPVIGAKRRVAPLTPTPNTDV